MRIKQVIGLVILFLGPFTLPSYGQVVAFWTDDAGNWSNSANWSSCVPDACPVVPNNGNGITYTAATFGGPVTFDASGTVVSTLVVSDGVLQDDGHSPTLTVGNLVADEGGTINWGNRSTLIVTGSMDGGFGSQINISGGSLLSIGGDYAGEDFHRLTVTNSTLRVQGSVVNNGSDLFLDGSKAVIGGNLIEEEGLAQFSTSSLNIGGGLVVLGGIGGGASIRNGSTLTAGGLDPPCQHS